MKKKIVYIIFTAIFMLIAMLPFVCMTFYKADNSGELRELADKAEIIKENKLNKEFGSDFDAYFGDHFAFRSELVDANATLKMKLFNTSAEEKVITGKDGWLFYTETLGDYSGTAALSDGTISRIAYIIKMESDYARENGQGYVFFVAPNKNTIYPEMMLSYYGKTSEKTNLDRLNEKLASLGVSVLDMKQVLLDAKKDGRMLYYKYDSHWNLYGAMIGYNAILDAIEKECGYKTTYTGWTEDSLSDGERIGDLLSMVTPVHGSAIDAYAEGEPEEIFKSKGKPITGADQLRIETKLKEAGDCTTKLLMYRDSFGRSIYKALANSFCEASFLRANPFALAGSTDENTVVVREIVERNISVLADFAAVMPAGQVSENKYDKVIKTEALNVQSENSGAYIHLYGYAKTNEIWDDYRAIVTLADGTSYEAFPIVEESLSSSEEKTVGFSLYITSEKDIADAKVTFFEG